MNSLAVGAADSRSKTWKRAPYSCIGPGRSPGLIKPEVIAFGGCSNEPFFVLDQSTSIATPDAGTSYASPYTLRMGMGVRAHFGNSLSMLAIKSLLVHCSEPAKKLPIHEIGWGRVAQDIDSIVICPDGEARGCLPRRTDAGTISSHAGSSTFWKNRQHGDAVSNLLFRMSD